ncbi:MAG: hypothetical protein WC449_05435 [Candidatus Paceibacterota bacterium]
MALTYDQIPDFALADFASCAVSTSAIWGDVWDVKSSSLYQLLLAKDNPYDFDLSEIDQTHPGFRNATLVILGRDSLGRPNHIYGKTQEVIDVESLLSRHRDGES